MKPNRVGQRFWVPHSSHCVTISALPAPPHFSCQEGQQKAGGDGWGGAWAGQKISWLIALHTGWQGPLSAKADWKACQLYNKSLSVFQFGKTFSSSNQKKLSHGTFSGFLTRWKKFLSSGFPCVVEGGTLGWYQHNGVAAGRQKGGTDTRTTLE